MLAGCATQPEWWNDPNPVLCAGYRPLAPDERTLRIARFTRKVSYGKVKSPLAKARGGSAQRFGYAKNETLKQGVFRAAVGLPAFLLVCARTAPVSIAANFAPQ